MHKPQKFDLYDFNANTFWPAARTTGQLSYVRRYLEHLGATSVLQEPYYFDRDYLSEFAAFYSVSAKGYANVCKRLHIFKGPKVSRSHVEQALGGNERWRNRLQRDYLGFIVVRPIAGAELGRTVLKWYPEHTPNTPRVVKPSRRYQVHVAGLPLEVEGLAWQQQDTGVAACATIAIWTMLHSSAFDDYHAIPTTADITKCAHKTASLGRRIFPAAKGLSIFQICEAIKECGFAPGVLDGDIQLPSGSRAFSPERFAASVASFIRSGYPVLLTGMARFPDGSMNGHAICAVGYRTSNTIIRADQSVGLQDSGVKFFYIHDDNLGPNVRFQMSADAQGNAILLPSPPALAGGNDLFAGYGPFVPGSIVVAVHNELRTDPDFLHRSGLGLAENFNNVLRHFNLPAGVSFSTRFVRLSDYFGHELKFLDRRPQLYAAVRAKLYEEVSPMSLHLGVIRVVHGPHLMLDVLVDTTDSQHSTFAHIAFNQLSGGIGQLLGRTIPLGHQITAY